MKNQEKQKGKEEEMRGGGMGEVSVGNWGWRRGRKIGKEKMGVGHQPCVGVEERKMEEE